MIKHVVFLDGVIGSGKSTIGRELALRMCGCFIDGDDYSDPVLPWYSSALSTCYSVFNAALTALKNSSVVVIAYPILLREWFFFKKHFGRKNINTFCIGLNASYLSIVAKQRQRVFSVEEKQRIHVMINEGYGQRSFSDFIINTGKSEIHDNVSYIEKNLKSSFDVV